VAVQAADRSPTRVKALHVSKFTVFDQANFKFSTDLNVIIGENGAGKTHILKLVYSILAVHGSFLERLNAIPPAKALLQTRIAEKLTNVFRSETLGRLARRQQGVQRCEIHISMTHRTQDTEFSFSTRSKTEVLLTRISAEWFDASPAYIPTRELLTIYPGFLSLYDQNALEFDETWRDTCSLLGFPPLRGPRAARVNELLQPLQDAMGGAIEYKSGRFYLRTSSGQMEMPLVAEGLRKLGMIAQLISTGALLGNGFLFWDEPEANLHPALIKKVARTILVLCLSGIQVFLATHSLFLLREFDILRHEPEFTRLKPQFIGLSSDQAGIVVQQGPSLDNIESLSALDEEIAQSDRFVEIEG